MPDTTAAPQAAAAVLDCRCGHSEREHTWESVVNTLRRTGSCVHREMGEPDGSVYVNFIYCPCKQYAPKPENPNACKTCGDKGMIPDTSPGRFTAWAQCPECKGVYTDANGKKWYDGGRHG